MFFVYNIVYCTVPLKKQKQKSAMCQYLFFTVGVAKRRPQRKEAIIRHSRLHGPKYLLFKPMALKI